MTLIGKVCTVKLLPAEKYKRSNSKSLFVCSDTDKKASMSEAVWICAISAAFVKKQAPKDRQRTKFHLRHSRNSIEVCARGNKTDFHRMPSFVWTCVQGRWVSQNRNIRQYGWSNGRRLLEEFLHLCIGSTYPEGCRRPRIRKVIFKTS